MISIARSSLKYEWRRYLAAILAVTFAGLLVVVQLSLLLGLFRTVSVAVDQSRADLWIGFPNTRSVDLGRTLLPGSDLEALRHPAVGRVERLQVFFGDLRKPDGGSVSVMVHALDPGPEALALAKAIPVELRRKLEVPGHVLADEADQGKLGAHVGDAVEVNGRRVVLAGWVRGLRAIGGVNLIASLTTARVLHAESVDAATYFLLGLRPGAEARSVAEALASTRQPARSSVWTAEDFSSQSQLYWLLESGAGIGSGFASLLALLVGLVITSQTLSGAILASIREFAALRALGVPRSSLRRVVMEQALWIGLAGLLLAGVITFLIAVQGRALHVAMAFPFWMVAGVAVVLLLIALGSGVIALRPLMKADPATLLR